ncbi:MAG: hypothetical protein Q9166_000145 [cf. Caloplaca sp. 2 TL-2023]
MATFITDLFTSIFTPGPTPTLLIATNVSFAALQALFFVLLILTYSIHFIVLSILCAGLWWSINWFASELEAARWIETEEEKKKEEQREVDQPEGGERRLEEKGTEDSGTETEAGDDPVPLTAPRKNVRTTATLQPENAEAEVRKRRSLASSTGDLSTDSEWDKVEEADTQR